MFLGHGHIPSTDLVVPIPEGVQGLTGGDTECSGLADKLVMGQKLDLILEVFSKTWLQLHYLSMVPALSKLLLWNLVAENQR